MNNLTCKNDNESILNMKLRWFITLAVITAALLIFKGFIAEQLFNRATSYYGFAMSKDAIREYKKVVLLNPDNEEALNWLGHSYFKSGKMHEAKDILKKAIKLNPRNYFACLDLGLIYVHEGELQKAKDVFYKVSLTKPDESNTQESYLRDYKNCLYWLGRVEIDLGETDEAIQTYKKILDFYPDDKGAKNQLNKILNNKGR